MGTKRFLGLLCAFGLIGLAVPSVSAAPDARSTTWGDIRHVGPDLNGGKAVPLDLRGARRVAREARRSAPSAYAVGDVKTWIGYDDLNGDYLKDFELRGVGDHIEVWVATGPSATPDDVEVNDLEFLPGDCRNDERVEITDGQVNYFIDEFDNNIFPLESEAFSVPASRDGTDAQLDDILELPADYYVGDGDKIVTLIDNVRDDNYYDLNNTNGYSYIAGFFYSLYDDVYFDRNVMTIDAYDWLHRTGAAPPDEPVPGDNCASKPARPYLYEGVFAHEYQHLLESDESPGEVNWVNEGLSDWAITLTGYQDPTIPIDEVGYSSHIQCFLGWTEQLTLANPNPAEHAGPENSLTAWGDQNDAESEILCDYGAANSIMEYLQGRYGDEFMSALHRDDGVGLEGLGDVLTQFGETLSATDLVHQWAAMMALDGVLDDGASLTGGAAADYTTPTLDATIDWDNDDAYMTPGAPPNGSDYVRLRGAGGAYLGAGDVTDISFQGAATLPPLPVEWKSVNKAPGRKGNSVLYSGSGPNFDRAIVKSAKVPNKKPRLIFKTRWETEPAWDFGFVQVSTDGGATYQSLGNPDTTSETDPDAIPLVKENVPGFTDHSGQGAKPEWVSETFNLKDYKGQEVLLSFRYITDGGVDLPGWWIDNVKVKSGKRTAKTLTRGTNLHGWQSVTEIYPTAVSGYTVQLVAYGDDHASAWIAQIPVDDAFAGSLSGADLAAAIGIDAETVAALVMYDEPTELVAGTRYAPYTLMVNGVTQPGGE